MQDAFIKIFNNLPKYSFESPFGGWIRRVTINTCLDEIRKTKRENFLFPVHELEKGDIYLQQGHQLEIQDILNFVESLPEGCKLILILYAVEGYNHKEIAKRLHISEGTSKSQLSRARKILKAHFKKETLKLLFQYA